MDPYIYPSRYTEKMNMQNLLDKLQRVLAKIIRLIQAFIDEIIH